jgi:hypothetical protein
MKFGQWPAVSLAALLCTASVALAQAPDKGAGGMGGAGQAPAEKMERGQGGGAAGRGQESPSRSMSQSGERRGAQPGPDRGNAERAQGSERSSGRAARPDTGPDTGKDQPKAAQGGRDRDQDRAQRTERNRAQDKATRTGQDQEQQKATRSSRDRDQEKAQRTDRDREQGKAAERRTPDKTGQMQPANRLQASDKQHADVRQHLLRDRKAERARLNISVNIGGHVPRSVRLHPLSTAVIGFAPVYRGYSYIVLEDETICIVDPRSYVIVDVIPASTQRAEGPGPGGHLTLSSDERRLVLSSIDRRNAADINVRLALGAEVPGAVEVVAFPERVIERIPRLRSYRYVVAQDQVVIVDPSDHQVALLLSE